MSSREFAEWMALYEVEPPDWQDEYRTALLASLIANTARDARQRRSPFRVDEFMRDAYRPEPSEKELVRKIQAMFGWLES